MLIEYICLMSSTKIPLNPENPLVDMLVVFGRSGLSMTAFPRARQCNPWPWETGGPLPLPTYFL